MSTNKHSTDTKKSREVANFYFNTNFQEATRFQNQNLNQVYLAKCVHIFFSGCQWLSAKGGRYPGT